MQVTFENQRTCELIKSFHIFNRDTLTFVVPLYRKLIFDVTNISCYTRKTNFHKFIFKYNLHSFDFKQLTWEAELNYTNVTIISLHSSVCYFVCQYFLLDGPWRELVGKNAKVEEECRILWTIWATTVA